MRLVIYPPVEPQRLARIEAPAAGRVEIVNAVDEAQACAAIVDADALFGRLTEAMLAAATRLRWVQAPTASLEHYLFPALVEHPAVLTNMRGLYGDVVADQALGYMLCLARNLHRYVRQQAAGRWEPIGGEAARSSLLAGTGTTGAIDRAHRHLSDAVLGIVGLGSIGRELAVRGAACGMRVVAVDPRGAAAPPEVARLEPLAGLDRLLVESEYVVVCAPHTPHSVRMFGRPQFNRMRRDAFFINVGRGALVDLEALAAALREGEISGAALDVFETEPLPSAHPLWAMENVILTPHVAGYGPRIAERHLRVFLDNLERFCRGQPLENVVDKRAWY